MVIDQYFHTWISRKKNICDCHVSGKRQSLAIAQIKKNKKQNTMNFFIWLFRKMSEDNKEE